MRRLNGSIDTKCQLGSQTLRADQLVQGDGVAIKYCAAVLAGAVILLAYSHASQAADAYYPIHQVAGECFGKLYLSEINEDLVKKSPVWPSTENTPPVPPRRAIAVADEMAKSLVVAPSDFQRYMVAVALTPVRGGWVWVVHYEWLLKRGAGTGIPNYFKVVVLMDGTAVKPMVSEQSR